jgi:dihydroflavonol-4-reductase
MNMITLVTGASGHIGVNLVKALIAQQRPVRVLVHHHKFPFDNPLVEVANGDICDINSLHEVFKDIGVVYHLAARISIAEDNWATLNNINVIGTRNVVDTCLRAGVSRLVHFSSIHALMQEPLDSAVDETRPPANSLQLPAYDRSKAAGEVEIQKGMQKGLNAIIIYPTAAIGPYDYQLSHLGAALLAMANGKLPAIVSGGFDWVDARDVANGAIKAENIAPTGSRYLLSGHWVSVRDLVMMTTQLTGVAVPRLVCPRWLACAAAPLAASIAGLAKKRPLLTPDSIRALKSNPHISHARATRELGYEPRPFRETLIDTLKWYKDNGKIRNKISQGCEN